ncbi:hypothetical protein Lal_00049842 [Lupinus albus]|nr:hypothetical protein Lal_00049842 [Lupinus albus]
MKKITTSKRCRKQRFNPVLQLLTAILYFFQPHFRSDTTLWINYERRFQRLRLRWEKFWMAEMTATSRRNS